MHRKPLAQDMSLFHYIWASLDRTEIALANDNLLPISYRRNDPQFGNETRERNKRPSSRRESFSSPQPGVETSVKMDPRLREDGSSPARG